MGPRLSLNILEERKISCPCRESKGLSQPIAQSLYQLSYKGSRLHDAEMSSKGDSYSTNERNIRCHETENSLPSLQTPSIWSWMLWASCIQSSSPQPISVTFAVVSPVHVIAVAQLPLCTCSLRRAPDKHAHTKAGCTTLSHFSEDCLSTKSRTDALKAVTAAVPQGRLDSSSCQAAHNIDMILLNLCVNKM